jgi:hypothetical protein
MPKTICSQSRLPANGNFVPAKIVLSYYGIVDDVRHRQELANPGDVRRVWSFVQAHLGQSEVHPAPAPPNLTIEFRDAAGRKLQVLYQDGAPGFSASGRFGALTREQQKELARIVRDYLGDDYYPVSD